MRPTHPRRHNRMPARARSLSRPLILSLVAALSACGARQDSAPNTSSAGTAGPAKIRIAAGGQAGGGSEKVAAAPAGVSTTAGAATDMALAPAGIVESVVSGDLPALDGDAQAWSYPAKSGLGAVDAAKLAKVFGVDGVPVAQPADVGGGFVVGSTDWTAPSVMLFGDSTGSWSYSRGGDSGGGVAVACAGEAKPASPDQPAPGSPTTNEPTTAAPPAECVRPAPPEGVPSESEAQAKALDVARQLGLDAKEGDVQSFGDEYARNVTVWATLDGLRTPFPFSVAFGGGGAITYANGSLAVPTKADRYPRIGTAAAIEALKAGKVGWYGPLQSRGGVAPATGAPEPAVGAADAGAATAGGGSAVETSAAGPPAIEPAIEPATEPMTPVSVPTPKTTIPPTAETVLPGTSQPGAVLPETVPPVTGVVAPETVAPYVVTITSVRESLTSVYAVDGTVWLVPAYDFMTLDGGSITVPAVGDEYIEVVSPSVTDGGAATEPGAGVSSGASGSGGGAVEPQPAPAPEPPRPATTVACIKAPCP